MTDKQIYEVLAAAETLAYYRHTLDEQGVRRCLESIRAALERQRDRPLKTTDTRVQAMFECPYCERRFLLDTTIRWEGDDSSAQDPDN